MPPAHLITPTCTAPDITNPELQPMYNTTYLKFLITDLTNVANVNPKQSSRFFHPQTYSHSSLIHSSKWHHCLTQLLKPETRTCPWFLPVHYPCVQPISSSLILFPKYILYPPSLHFHYHLPLQATIVSNFPTTFTFVPLQPIFYQQPENLSSS